MAKKIEVRANSVQVVGTKILKNGKLGASKTFPSIKIAAEKVAPNSNVRTAASNISHALREDCPSAYGYVWSY